MVGREFPSLKLSLHTSYVQFQPSCQWHIHICPTNNIQCIVGSSCLLGQIVGGPLCRYIKRSRIILISSCASLLAFSASMVSINPGEEKKGIALMFMACFSVGIIEACSLSLVPLSCPSEDLGVALGTLGSIRSGGAAVATAIFVTVLTNKLTKFVPAMVAPAAIAAGLPESSLTQLFANLATGTLAKTPGINADIITAVVAANAQAGANSFRYDSHHITCPVRDSN